MFFIVKIEEIGLLLSKGEGFRCLLFGDNGRLVGSPPSRRLGVISGADDFAVLEYFL